MNDDEDLQIAGTTSDYLIQQLTDEEGRKDFAREYLKSAFLSSAVNTLCSMRQHAGLTQSQVAERLNTKQSAIARLEGDFDGGISLRRYVDFALACGMVPHNITFAPLESAINYTIDQSKIAYTQVNDQEWLKANSPLISVSVESVAQVESNSEMISKRFQAQKDAVLSIERHTRRTAANSSTVAALPVTTLQYDRTTQEYVQLPLNLKPRLELLQGRTSTVLEPQDKIEYLAPSQVS